MTSAGENGPVAGGTASAAAAGGAAAGGAVGSTSGAAGGGTSGAAAGGTAAGQLAWRPMAFGRRPARHIRDPLIEPMWTGRRVLVWLRTGSPAGGAATGAGVGLPGSGSGGSGAGGSGAGGSGSGGSGAGNLLISIADEAGFPLAGHPDLQAALATALLVDELVLDGYLVALPPHSARLGGGPEPEAPNLAASTRQLLVGTRSSGRRKDRSPAPDPRAGEGSGIGPLSFVAIDLLLLDGEPLLDVPLVERKRLLDGVLAVSELVRRSPHVRLPAANWYGQWRALGFRAMAVKEANGRYRPGEPSTDWAIAPIPDR